MSRIFDRLVRLRPEQGWMLCLLSIDVVALTDLLAEPELWFGPVYLLAICVAAWSLGWKAGQLTGIACMGLTLAINGHSLYPYGDADFAWNLAMRFTAISIVVAVIAGVRRAYVGEWWLARTDALTGALNRQAFFELSHSAIDPHSWRLLVYADLDGLKQVNDLLGHAAGDAQIKSFGTSVREMIRRNDLFARLGGDEFVIFMSLKNEIDARAVAVRLHKTMNTIPGENGKLRCSVGGLVVPPGLVAIDDLVRSADNLMYEAKLRGASLQLGVASNVANWAPGSARAASRTNRALARGRRVEDRRAYAESFVDAIVPR